MHHQQIEQEGDDTGGKVGHHLGRTVETGFSQLLFYNAGPYEPQALSGSGKVNEADKGRNGVPGYRGDGCTGNTHSHGYNQHIVQHCVGNACQQGEEQSDAGLSLCYKKHLKLNLKHEGGSKRQLPAQVGDAVLKKQVAGSQHTGKGYGRQVPKDGKDQPDYDIQQDNGGEGFSGETV